MLPKQYRLVKKKDFEKIFKQGRSCYSRLLGVKTMVNQLQFNRFGVIVSTKVSKKAIVRNKLKRQIRQVLKEFDQKIILGQDLIIMALPGVFGQDYNVIKSDLKKSFINLRLLQ